MARGHFDQRELDLDGGRLLRVCLWPPCLSVDQDGEKSSVAVQPRELYITNVSGWRLLISQVSIGTGAAANQWGHFILLEHLLFDARYRLAGLIPVLWGFFCSVL